VTERFLVETVVPGVDWAVPVIRHCVGRTLTAAGHQNVENAELVVSELVSNSVLHTRSARCGGLVTVEVRAISDALVRIEVTDEGARTSPCPRESGGEDCHGRGLWLVEQVSARWGTRPQPLGWNTVWAEVFTTDDAPDRPPHGLDCLTAG
jgi:anti-sigma regulatory factor (Ser/Thr protein kinase)